MKQKNSYQSHIVLVRNSEFALNEFQFHPDKYSLVNLNADCKVIYSHAFLGGGLLGQIVRPPLNELGAN